MVDSAAVFLVIKANPTNSNGRVSGVIISLARYKCDTILVAESNVTLCCYSTKCDTIIGNSILLLPWFRDFYICFRVVCILVPPVPMLYLKDSRMGNDTIY